MFTSKTTLDNKIKFRAMGSVTGRFHSTGNSFVDTVHSRVNTRTENGMFAHSSTSDPVVDLFYKIGASRGKNISKEFESALMADTERALRVAQWARDVRSGAGERQLFRDILSYLEHRKPNLVLKLIHNIPEIGRWDDLLVFKTEKLKLVAFNMIGHALINDKNGLCAKWMPRKGSTAVELRNFLGLTPKQYRKLLVTHTNVVESLMCDNHWNVIDFQKVPSLASARYKKAFERNSVEFGDYVKAVSEGKAKVNAGAVYPHDVLKTVFSKSTYGFYGGYSSSVTAIEKAHIQGQWNSLPDFMNGKNVLPMVDVSGSMNNGIGGGPSNLKCMDISTSLGLYTATKTKGAFKNLYLTFSNQPKFIKITQPNIVDAYEHMVSSRLVENTNIIKAFTLIAEHANQNGVPASDMPEVLLILSDMQFDNCVRFDDRAFDAAKRIFAQNGYRLPKVVFWNLRASDNVPVKSHESGVALVSGFSPSILKAVLSGDTEQFTPRGIMDKAIMSTRYNLK